MPVKLSSTIHSDQHEARIEIVPLIDIMFFLLASFMLVSLSMVNLKTVKVNLPTAATAAADVDRDTVNLSVNAGGGNDDIVVAGAGGRLDLSSQGGDDRFVFRNFARIANVYGGPGTDTIESAQGPLATSQIPFDGIEVAPSRQELRLYFDLPHFLAWVGSRNGTRLDLDRLTAFRVRRVPTGDALGLWRDGRCLMEIEPPDGGAEHSRSSR